jgi:hypothetical protein
MGEAKRKKAKLASSTDDPKFQRNVFTQAFEQTCKVLDDPEIDDLHALLVTHRGRNGMIDQTAQTYARGMLSVRLDVRPAAIRWFYARHLRCS